MRCKNNFLLKIYGILNEVITFASRFGTLAQSVEQWTENPCVPGSIPGGTTFKMTKTFQSYDLKGFFYFSNNH